MKALLAMTRLVMTRFNMEADVMISVAPAREITIEEAKEIIVRLAVHLTNERSIELLALQLTGEGPAATAEPDDPRPNRLHVVPGKKENR